MSLKTERWQLNAVQQKANVQSSQIHSGHHVLPGSWEAATQSSRKDTAKEVLHRAVGCWRESTPPTVDLTHSAPTTDHSPVCVGEMSVALRRTLCSPTCGAQPQPLLLGWEDRATCGVKPAVAPAVGAMNQIEATGPKAEEAEECTEHKGEIRSNAWLSKPC